MACIVGLQRLGESAKDDGRLCAAFQFRFGAWFGVFRSHAVRFRGGRQCEGKKKYRVTKCGAMGSRVWFFFLFPPMACVSRGVDF